jgi:hypothetical protein
MLPHSLCFSSFFIVSIPDTMNAGPREIPASGLGRQRLKPACRGFKTSWWVSLCRALWFNDDQ